MDLDKLESKLVELLNLHEDEKNLALKLFKGKIQESLKLGEALKIEQLGVFQLKEKLGEREKMTLLFSPNENIGDNDALFINLEVNENTKNDNEFSEDVFQLGINKRFIPVKGSNEDTENNLISDLEKRIDGLLNTSTKLENFDLWDDYLKDKESTSIIEGKNNIDEAGNENFFEDNIVLDDDPLYGEDFEEVSEDELFDDLVHQKDVSEDDILEEPIVDEGSDYLVENDTQEEIAEIDEDKLIENLDTEFEENNIEPVDIESEYVEEVVKEDEAGGDDSEELTIAESTENSEGDIKEEVESSISEADKINVVETNENKIKDVIGDLDNETGQLYKKRRNQKAKKSPLIYALITGFIIIGAIGIYYLFFQNPTWLYDKYEVEAKLQEQHAKEFDKIKEGENVADLSNDELKQNEKTIIDNDNGEKKVNEKNVEKKADSKNKKKTLAQNSQKKLNESSKPIPKEKTKKVVPLKNNSHKVKVIPATKNESEAAKNIYFDGKNYSVQISSWKKSEIANREAEKLIKKGYPAYVVKKYIAKLNGTWHRVRVGPYGTIGKAKSIMNKLK